MRFLKLLLLSASYAVARAKGIPALPENDGLPILDSSLDIAPNESIPARMETSILKRGEILIEDFPSASSEVEDLNVEPIQYSIRFSPNVKSKSFTSSVKLDFKVLHDSKEFKLHSVGLNITKTSLKIGNSTVNMNAATDVSSSDKQMDITYNESSSTITLTFDSELSSQKEYQLNLEVEGKITEDLNSLIYADSSMKGEGSYMLYTVFEPEGARRLFPCVDDPSVRALFSWEIEHDENVRAVSNTDVESSEQSTEEGRKVTKFVRTPPMTTYHNAFCLMKGSEKVDITNVGRVKVEGYSNLYEEKNLDDIKYFKPAFEILARVMEYLEEKFKIKYPFETLRLVLIPKINEYLGGYENFGMITLLGHTLSNCPNIDEGGETSCDYSALVHEAVHQWLGGIITVRFWNQLWIKEGLTQWMTSKVLRDLYPDYYEKNGVCGDPEFSLKADALGIMPPFELERTTKIDPAWENIWKESMYTKSVNVFNILSNTIGEEAFVESLSGLINKHSFKAVGYDDVVDAFREAPGDTKTFLNAWVKNPHHPIVTLFEFSKDESSIVLRQKPDLTLPDRSNVRLDYPIVIDLITGNGQEESVVLENDETKIDLNTKDAPYVMFNVSKFDRAFYQPAYSLRHLKLLANQGKKKVLPAELRIELLNQVKDQPRPLAVLLDLWKTEDDPAVFKVMMDHVNTFTNLFSKHMPDLVPHLHKFRASLLDDRLNWMSKTNFTYDHFWSHSEFSNNGFSESRLDSVKYGCLFNHSATYKICSDLYSQHTKGIKDESIAKLRYSYLTHAVSYAHEEIRQNATRALRKIVVDPSVDEGERFETAWALAKSEDKDELYNLLDDIVANEELLAEEGPFFPTLDAAMTAMAENYASYHILWQWVKDRWDIIKQRETLKFAATIYPITGLVFFKENNEVCSFFKERREDLYEGEADENINNRLVRNYYRIGKMRKDTRSLFKFFIKKGYLEFYQLFLIKPAMDYPTSRDRWDQLCLMGSTSEHSG